MADGYLEHHGILGMKWGIRRYQNADGSLTSEGKKRYLANNDGYTKKNSDGSIIIKKGFVFNRVGGKDLDFNETGALYVSDASSNDVNRYIKSLGPTFIGNLMGQSHHYVKQLSATKDFKMMSDDEFNKTALDILSSNASVYNAWSKSFYGQIVPSSQNDIENTSYTSKKGKQIAASLSAAFADPNCSTVTKQCYDVFRKMNYDAIPDIFDKTSGTSETPIIIINKDVVKQTTSDYLTKDIIRDGKAFVKQAGKIKLDESIWD